ncbi:heat-shock protein Hsp20 [Thermogymnomonas acidicola]|uniref:Heat-shock protein Hsp20 n=1 Tax=Thermogymnomonas acidicola TaxID=399579 RepID=A0AA37BQB4_9ARCH|nr:archaeal heat shock protein Hsp14 [Thermogymnomonas acidicola]GGM69568.1 heat-shock protein Hsp20 [Thermogymnomonas acidicola]
MADVYGPLKYFTGEMVKNLNERAKEIMTFLYPPITMYQEAGELVIHADMPGFDKKDIHVSVERNAVTISATRKLETGGVVFMDQRPEKVTKRVRLPVEVDMEASFTASYTNGVLTIRIPSKGVRSIEIE